MTSFTTGIRGLALAAALAAGTASMAYAADPMVGGATLTRILTYHVVAGRIDAAEIVKGIKAGGGSYNMKTVEGETLTAKMDGDKVALIDAKGTGALVEIAYVFQSNGVVHVIDSVLMPK